MGSNAENVTVLNQKGDTIPASAVIDLQTSVKGEILVKGEAAEDTYRQAIYRCNEAYILESSIIVFVESDQDVIAALEFVQKWNIDLAVACGRHSYYGASSTKGLVIDLCKLRNVSIDKEAMTISAGGGCKAVHLETPLQELGLSVVMGAVNDTGIGGITLGGGTGFLTGRYGLVADNLIRARVVLANGTVVETSEEENPDLLWCLRGGGPNFGVVTEFTYQVHNQDDVFFGPVMWGADKTEAVFGLINTIKKIVDDQEGKLVVFVGFARFPGTTKAGAATIIFYDGPEAEARGLLKPLFDLGPMADKAGVRKLASTTQEAIGMGGPPTHQQFSTSAIQLRDLSKDLPIARGMIEGLDALHDKYGIAVAPSKVIIELRSYKQSSSVPTTATAVGNREPVTMAVFEGQFNTDITKEVIREEIVAVMDKARAQLKENHPGKKPSNVTNIGTGTEKLEDIFGENLPKLRELKRRYDPGFIFNKWYPIPPAEA